MSTPSHRHSASNALCQCTVQDLSVVDEHFQRIEASLSTDLKSLTNKTLPQMTSELYRLETFAVVNAEGFRKIIKKLAKKLNAAKSAETLWATYLPLFTATAFYEALKLRTLHRTLSSSYRPILLEFHPITSTHSIAGYLCQCIFYVFIANVACLVVVMASFLFYTTRSTEMNHLVITDGEWQTLMWWSAMTLCAMFNINWCIGLWRQYVVDQTQQRSGYRTNMLCLSTIYVIVCAARAIWPVQHSLRRCMFDQVVTVFVDRAIATIAGKQCTAFWRSDLVAIFCSDLE